MRVHVIVAGLILAVIGKANATVVDKATDAQKSCELLVQNSFRNQDEARSAGVCEGMIETAMLFSPNLPANVRACPPRKAAPCKVPRFFWGILITIRIERVSRGSPSPSKHSEMPGPAMGTMPGRPPEMDRRSVPPKKPNRTRICGQ